MKKKVKKASQEQNKIETALIEEEIQSVRDSVKKIEDNLKK
jgi:hypothetical protein